MNGNKGVKDGSVAHSSWRVSERGVRCAWDRASAQSLAFCESPYGLSERYCTFRLSDTNDTRV